MLPVLTSSSETKNKGNEVRLLTVRMNTVLMFGKRDKQVNCKKNF